MPVDCITTPGYAKYIMKILSGIQPSGVVHLGNYLGAMRQHIALAKEAEQALYMLVDLHAITAPQEPNALRRNTLSLAALYLAAGLDQERAALFIQSHVPAHAELGWILTTLTTMGELERMTQFKEKGRGDDRASIGVGLLAYPALMAADILLYDTTHVPVGEDQVQHVELARDLAKRFNYRFGETFAIPEPQLVKGGARIMGLDDPAKKMSKSATSEYNYIALTDTPEAVERKIRKAVTDSGSEITYANDKPALKNLLTIYAGVTDRSIEDIVAAHQSKGYGDFKAGLAEAINEFLAPIQAKYHELMANEDELLRILHAGADRARPIAEETLMRVKTKIGFIA